MLGALFLVAAIVYVAAWVIAILALMFAVES